MNDARGAPAPRPPVPSGDVRFRSRRLSLPHPCVVDGRQDRGGGNARRQGPGERVGNTPARFLLVPRGGGVDGRIGTSCLPANLRPTTPPGGHPRDR